MPASRATEKMNGNFTPGKTLADEKVFRTKRLVYYLLSDNGNSLLPI
jgi:hypothetical protein